MCMCILSFLSSSHLRPHSILKLDIPEDQINHKTMLRRLMQLLLEDEKEAASTTTEQVQATTQDKMSAAKAERERKKQEAIERSKARQKDPNYFQKISESNVKPEPKVLDGLEEIQSSTESEDAGEGGSGQGASDDPFSNKTKSRGKIHFNF